MFQNNRKQLNAGENPSSIMIYALLCLHKMFTDFEQDHKMSLAM